MPSKRRQINFRPHAETLALLETIKEYLEKRSGPMTMGDVLREIIHTYGQTIPPEKKNPKKISKGT